MNIFQDLHQRGLIHNFSDNMGNLLPSTNNQITFYIGFDPTSDSLHVGSLLGLITAIRFIQHGHKAIFLIGGATGLIGDPSGKSTERNLLDKELVQQNSKAIQEQIQLLMTSSGIQQDKFQFVNNISWLENMNILTFLRDIGKHVRVNNLLNKESIKRRLESDEGISFTEFTYNLIQAFDFAHLANNKGCHMQLGGSDQWGNIVSGIDLSRKLFNKEVHGLTFPLLTKSDGTKFGKTESKTIFLNKEKTSPFAFFQFWLNISDEEAIKMTPFLLPDSMEPTDENNHTGLLSLINLAKDHPTKRILQRLLATHLTRLVHGEEELNRVSFNSAMLFDTKACFADICRIHFESILNDIPHKIIPSSHINDPISSLIPLSGLTSSKTETRNLIKMKGLSINNILIEDDKPLPKNMLIRDKFLLVRKGKKDLCVLVFSN